MSAQDYRCLAETINFLVQLKNRDCSEAIQKGMQDISFNLMEYRDKTQQIILRPPVSQEECEKIKKLDAMLRCC
jgi:hypothetical protein